MVPPRRVRGCAALFQPDLVRAARQSSFKRRLQRRERQLLRGGPQFRRKLPQKEFAIIPGYFEHSVRQRLTSSPATARGAPVYPIVVHSGNPKRPIGHHAPSIHATEHPSLESTTSLAQDFGDVEGRQSSNG